jgi:two-component system NtrC family sensor kinase
MLWLGLVVGSVALLVAGTAYGIRAYTATVKTTERKMIELQLATNLVETLKGPDQYQFDPTTERRELEQVIQSTRIHLKNFRDENERTVAQSLDPDQGAHESGLLQQLEAELNALQSAIQTGPVTDTGTTVSLLRQDNVRPHYETARRITEHLRLALINDIEKSIRDSNRTINQSKWVVYSATAWNAVFILALLYYFRVWIYSPFRQLQAGVQRVHSGDFEHPIILSSGDELEELANEFNAMISRLAAIYADLARQVNERSRQLVRSERMVSVGFLAAGVAHEINNPLASILFCSEALERRLQDVLATMASAAAAVPPADAEVLARYLKMIQQEALRCKDITQKLLDFSRTGDRKRESTDLAGLVRGVLEVARHLPNCRGKNITFEPGAYIVAPVNGQDLKSVILNLVVNALDSMEEGGRLAIGLSTAAGNAELVFADTGCGMTPEVLHNIFEPFYTRSRTGKGTGLGLFISHQIIDQHGGTIEAASPGPGFGSTFTVRVPLTEVKTQDAGERQDTPEPATLPFPGSRAAA